MDELMEAKKFLTANSWENMPTWFSMRSDGEGGALIALDDGGLSVKQLRAIALILERDPDWLDNPPD